MLKLAGQPEERGPLTILISILLEQEKELGKLREKIEVFEGQEG